MRCKGRGTTVLAVLTQSGTCRPALVPFSRRGSVAADHVQQAPQDALAIGPQAVLLTSTEHPEQSVRVATDGLRPFKAGAASP